MWQYAWNREWHSTALPSVEAKRLWSLMEDVPVRATRRPNGMEWNENVNIFQQLTNIITPLTLEAWHLCMQHHPDQQFAQYMWPAIGKGTIRTIWDFLSIQRFWYGSLALCVQSSVVQIRKKIWLTSRVMSVFVHPGRPCLLINFCEKRAFYSISCLSRERIINGTFEWRHVEIIDLPRLFTVR